MESTSSEFIELTSVCRFGKERYPDWETEAALTYFKIVLREEKVKSKLYEIQAYWSTFETTNLNTQHKALYNYLLLSQATDKQ